MTIAEIIARMPEMYKLVEPIIPIFAGATAVTVSGLTPRVGPGRALWIYLSSRFRPLRTPLSIRDTDLRTIRSVIALKDWGQSYMVVTGEKGVGKSCLLDTATNKTGGVLSMSVYPGMGEGEIVQNALRQLTHLRVNTFDIWHSARRVTFWYRLFTRTTPIIIMRVAERDRGDPFPSLTGAVRTLTDSHGLRIIVDALPNSINESLLQTIRQIEIDIQPMTREMIWSLPDLQPLFAMTRKMGLDDVLWGVYGGVPSRYSMISLLASENSKDGLDTGVVLCNELCSEIYSAIRLVLTAKATFPALQEIITLYNKSVDGHLDESTLDDKSIQGLISDKIFRADQRDGVPVLVPASNAIGIVLRYNLTKKPTMDELRSMISDRAVK